VGVPDPKTPTRADHRYIKQVLSTSLEGKVVELPHEFDRIARVFSKAGGSWQRIFQGSVQDTVLLRMVIKLAYKKGYLTKKGKW
jgi:hypothetical protein